MLVCVEVGRSWIFVHVPSTYQDGWSESRDGDCSKESEGKDDVFLVKITAFEENKDTRDAKACC